MLTKSKTVIFPVENMIALLGLATGNIKADPADITTGISMYIGLMSDLETY